MGLSSLTVYYSLVVSEPVTIRWSTGSELDTAGFNLLRGADRRGPFVKVNQQLIPASPDSLTGGAYSYLDSGGESANARYYLLQSVSNSGTIKDLEVIEVPPDAWWARKPVLVGLTILTSVIVLALLLRSPLQRLAR